MLAITIIYILYTCTEGCMRGQQNAVNSFQSHIFAEGEVAKYLICEKVKTYITFLLCKLLILKNVSLT